MYTIHSAPKTCSPLNLHRYVLFGASSTGYTKQYCTHFPMRQKLILYWTSMVLHVLAHGPQGTLSPFWLYPFDDAPKTHLVLRFHGFTCFGACPTGYSNQKSSMYPIGGCAKNQNTDAIQILRNLYRVHWICAWSKVKQFFQHPSHRIASGVMHNSHIPMTIWTNTNCILPLNHPPSFKSSTLQIKHNDDNLLCACSAQWSLSHLTWPPTEN